MRGSLYLLPGFLVLLSACSTTPSPHGSSQHVSSRNHSSGTNQAPQNSSRYTMEKDAYPDHKMDANDIHDAVPQHVERSASGNKSPYTVLGETYRIIDNPSGFTESGYGSWYGLKFQGHMTSSGETYDMYAMTAAHKTLPIPTYVRVTNLDNGLSTVVRVNDRGPFHDGRIIDLSYAAATKLDYADKGTAHVKLEVLDAGEKYNVTEDSKTPEHLKLEPQAQAVKVPLAHARAPDEQNYHLPGNTYLQVAAFSNRAGADDATHALQALTGLSVSVREKDHLYKVWVGPVVDNFDLMDLRELITSEQLGTPVVVYDE